MIDDKDNIRNYLENSLTTHDNNDIMDNNDRKVWMSDVVDVVYKLFQDNNLNLIKTKCTCWKCVGLEKDPYEE